MIYKTGERLTEKEFDKVSHDLYEILERGEDAIIDMKSTKYITSSGIRILIMYLKQFRAKGYDFSVVNVEHPLLKEIFTMVGLDDIMLTNKNYFNDNKNNLK